MIWAVAPRKNPLFTCMIQCGLSLIHSRTFQIRKYAEQCKVIHHLGHLFRYRYNLNFLFRNISQRPMFLFSYPQRG